MTIIPIELQNRVKQSYAQMPPDELARRIQIEREHESLDHVPVVVLSDLSSEARKQTRRTVHRGR